ncbi:MAG: DUF2304 domain-containing protein [Planctomycetes bacterium]|nr:DUF2304 domain-containing protein [Planctomycetota bacterium]
MTPRQQLFAILVALVTALLIVNLVRKRRLAEEYSVLWILTSIGMLLIVFHYEWLLTLTHWSGAVLPTTFLFIVAIVFLLLLAVQFSLVLTRLKSDHRKLVQDNALLRNRVVELEKRLPGIPGRDASLGEGAAGTKVSSDL